MTIKLFENRAAKGGFAGADFTRELDEALALTNAVQQVVERLAMFGAIKQEPRVGSNVERRFGQAVIVQIHAENTAISVPGVFLLRQEASQCLDPGQCGRLSSSDE